MKKSLMVILTALIAIGSVSAMPSQYNDDSDGWFGVYLFYSYPIGQGVPTFGLGIRGGGQGDIGIDFQFLAGGITGISAGAVYFYNPPNSDRYSFPLGASLGYFLTNAKGFGANGGWDNSDSGIGLELSAGATLYALGGVYDTTENESAYLELGGRAATYLYGKGLHFAVEGLAGGSMSLTPSSGDSGYYYVYY